MEYSCIKKDREQFTVDLRLFEGTLVQEDCHQVNEISDFLERLKNCSSSVDIDDLFRNGDSRVFLHGIAGIGKTSFVEYLTLSWANRKILREFDFLFLLKCRNLIQYKDKDDIRIESLFDQLFNVDVTKLKKTVSGERVIVIIDGLDELPSLESVLDDRTKSRLDSTLHSLLCEKSPDFSGHKCILTGRPHIYSLLQKYETDTIGKLTIYEITGFDQKAIELYVDNFTSGSALMKVHILDTIEHNCSLRVLASVPQFLSSICCILATQTVSLSTSRTTELYIWVLVSYIRQRFYEIKDMPYKIFEDQRFQNFLTKISTISYNLLIEDKMVFKAGELSKLLETEDELERKLLDSFIVKTETVTGCMYQFRHISLQEFLAAIFCYVSSVNIEALLTKKMYGLIEFVAGFACAKKHGPLGHQSISSHFVEGLLKKHTVEDFKFVLPNIEVITRALFSRLKDRNITWRPFFSILYELYSDGDRLPKEITFESNIDFSFYHLITIECIHFCRFMHLLLTSYGNDALSGISVRIMSTDINRQISENLALLVKHFRKVKFISCKIDPTFLKSICNSIQASSGNISLMVLAFVECGLTDEELCSLSRCFVYLEEIEFGYTKFTAKFFSSIEENCKLCERQNPGSLRLRKMRLNCCDFSEGSVRCLSNIIPFLETLDVSGCKLNEGQISEIVDSINRGKESLKLKNLMIERCNLQDACVEKLCEVIPLLFYVDISRSATAPDQQEISNDVVATMIRNIEIAFFNNHLRLKKLIMNSFSRNEETRRKFLALKKDFHIDVCFFRVSERRSKSSLRR